MAELRIEQEALQREMERLDFRGNIIVDADNPILIQKAWRDRFSKQSHWQACYGGEAYLGRANGEDALTWNVFRFLEKTDKLRVVQKYFGVTNVVTLLFWGCDVEGRSDVQQQLNCLIRAIDGRHPGTMTEPDLVIVTEAEVVFVECKLGGTRTQSPWKAQGEGAQKRHITYADIFPELEEIPDWRPVYQLIRQYVYARSLAALLGKTPLVVPLVNEKLASHWQPLYEPLVGFRGDVFRPMATWQGIRARVGDSEVRKKIDEALEAAGLARRGRNCGSLSDGAGGVDV